MNRMDPNPYNQHSLLSGLPSANPDAAARRRHCCHPDATVDTAVLPASPPMSPSSPDHVALVVVETKSSPLRTHRRGVPYRAIQAIHHDHNIEFSPNLSRQHADVDHSSKIGTVQALPSPAKLALLTADSCRLPACAACFCPDPDPDASPCCPDACTAYPTPASPAARANDAVHLHSLATAALRDSVHCRRCCRSPRLRSMPLPVLAASHHSITIDGLDHLIQGSRRQQCRCRHHRGIITAVPQRRRPTSTLKTPHSLQYPLPAT
ncbi:hypothetical protein ACLOJK_022929, partial [Asimina triloba]